MDDVEQLTITTLRALTLDMVEAAGSGHPGLPLGAAPMAWALWRRHLAIAPSAAMWPNRDRFVLSAGHGSALLYALLHLSCPQRLPLDELRRFRQLGSLTPGHPEAGHTAGVEVTTGPLGQGAGQAVGLAMAERRLAHEFNRAQFALCDHYTIALLSDGDMMEGVTSEAMALAGHLRLSKLIFLYDANEVTLDGPLALSQSEDVCARASAQGWRVLHVADGDRDLAALDAALVQAKVDEGRPTLLRVRTTLGFGSPAYAGLARSHGAPLGRQETLATKAALGWPACAPFSVPDAVRARMQVWQQEREAHLARWHKLAAAYAQAFPVAYGEYMRRMGDVPGPQARAALSSVGFATPLATRQAMRSCLQALGPAVPELFGGDADLSTSTLTALAEGRFAPDGSGRHVAYGVREHAMAAATCGLARHGGLWPLAATFLVFSDYLRPALRLAAMGRLKSLWLFTHDSVALGEDGPTHQPIEQMASLRAMPHVALCRPADARETQALMIQASEHDGPVAFALSRQALPLIDEAMPGRYGHAGLGGYVVTDPAQGRPQGILIATGSEVSLALQAAAALAAQGRRVRVASLPCWAWFEAQPQAYRDEVLLPHVHCRVAVEAASSLGWERYVGLQGRIVAIDTFGTSAPGAQAQQALGISVEHIVAAYLACERELGLRSQGRIEPDEAYTTPATPSGRPVQPRPRS